MYPKKIFVRGAIRGIDFEKSLLERLSPEGVKTGINYPHTRLTTCIRVTKIPVWPTIVAENKDFCQSNLPLGETFLRTPKQLKDA